MKKFLLLMALCAYPFGCINLCAGVVKVNELYYNINKVKKTAEVTYKSYSDADGHNKDWNIKTANIPAELRINGDKYKVTKIDACAFKGCSSLNSLSIPNSVTYIGNAAFANCTLLSSVNIPSSVNTIESYAFYDCHNLRYVSIPNCHRITIGVKAFSGCPKAIIYTMISWSLVSAGIPSHRIVELTSEQFAYNYPFSKFAKIFVEDRINEWQKKDEFERTYDWQKRVNEQTRQEKIKESLAEAEMKYIQFHTSKIILNPILGKYDADNEVFAMSDVDYGTVYMAVPISEAKDFKDNWMRKQMTPQFQIKDDQIKLSALTIQMPNKKQYTYRNTDAVNYNLAEMEYNFEPIELDFAENSSSQQGQRNITTTKIKAGKSEVDTNIPVTDISNNNTFVIILANEDYRNVAPVPFAKNDGMIFQKYCQKTLGIPTTNIHYVENASYNDIRIQLAWLNDVCDAFEGQTSIIVYYAGHGIPDEASKSAYLLPVDGDSRYVQSAYKLDDMYQKLGSLKAKNVTVFMDACFSGSKREDGMLASARGVAIKANNGQPTGNMVVFSAATGDQTAYPNNQEGHGMFTYYLLKKLQDTKGDVTYEDLANYIKQNVAQQSIVLNGKSQTPTVTASPAVTDWQSWKLK